MLEFQLQHHSFQRTPRADLLQNGLDGSPCSPRDSQESPPTPQFKSINSSALSLLHSPTRTSIGWVNCDFWAKSDPSPIFVSPKDGFYIFKQLSKKSKGKKYFLIC